jgi:hypothetical protein
MASTKRGGDAKMAAPLFPSLFHGSKWSFCCPPFSAFRLCGLLFTSSFYRSLSYRHSLHSIVHGSPQDWLRSSTTIRSFLRKPILSQPLQSGIPTTKVQSSRLGIPSDHALRRDHDLPCQPPQASLRGISLSPTSPLARMSNL